ncbi:MAG: sugar kinase [Chloroflexi bacterium]|nr:sugar kinase [Chloroflexota bacterium]
MTKLVTFGETLAQYNATYIGVFREDGEYILDCAGAESNVAVDLNKLGIPGIETLWISRVGDDSEGDFVLRELRGRTGVAAEKCEGQRTGVSYLNHHADGQHVKTYRRKGSAASSLTFLEVKPHLGDADLLHVTGITPALSDDCRRTIFAALDFASRNTIPVSFDLNYREQLWTPADARAVFDAMLARSTLFKLGHDEAETIWGKGWTPERYAEHFQKINEGLVVVTRGMNGAVAFDGVNMAEHRGYKVEVIDPVGAGDAFVAGFLGGIMEGCSLKDFLGLDAALRKGVLEHSLQIANACGALTCTRRGDTAAMPTMKEVREFIEKYEQQEMVS